MDGRRPRVTLELAARARWLDLSSGDGLTPGDANEAANGGVRTELVGCVQREL